MPRDAWDTRHLRAALAAIAEGEKEEKEGDAGEEPATAGDGDGDAKPTVECVYKEVGNLCAPGTLEFKKDFQAVLINLGWEAEGEGKQVGVLIAKCSTAYACCQT